MCRACVSDTMNHAAPTETHNNMLTATPATRDAMSNSMKTFESDAAAIGGSEPCRRRRVRFDKHIRVRTTLHYKDYKDEEMIRAWYTPSERFRMRRINLKAVELMDEGIIGPQRGLEAYTKDGSAQRQIRKDKVKVSVLLEQERQRQEDISDPHSLACVSFSSSLESRTIALVHGMSDAQWLERQLKKGERTSMGACLDTPMSENVKMMSAESSPASAMQATASR